MDLLERFQRAGPPATDADGQGAYCANAPEQGIADAGVLQDVAHFSVHGQMNGQHYSEQNC